MERLRRFDVAEHRGEIQQQQDRHEIHDAGRRERASGEEQRVARQQRRDDDARLEENDEEQEPVDPGAVQHREVAQVLVYVEDEVEQEGDLVQRGSAGGQFGQRTLHYRLRG